MISGRISCYSPSRQHTVQRRGDLQRNKISCRNCTISRYACKSSANGRIAHRSRATIDIIIHCCTIPRYTWYCCCRWISDDVVFQVGIRQVINWVLAGIENIFSDVEWPITIRGCNSTVITFIENVIFHGYRTCSSCSIYPTFIRWWIYIMETVIVYIQSWRRVV